MYAKVRGLSAVANVLVRSAEPVAESSVGSVMMGGCPVVLVALQGGSLKSSSCLLIANLVRTVKERRRLLTMYVMVLVKFPACPVAALE
jgi:hypothetical protein